MANRKDVVHGLQDSTCAHGRQLVQWPDGLGCMHIYCTLRFTTCAGAVLRAHAMLHAVYWPKLHLAQSLHTRESTPRVTCNPMQNCLSIAFTGGMLPYRSHVHRY